MRTVLNYNQSKRNYHPLIIILFTSGMLSTQELNELPRTTKYNWKHFNHDNYFGHQWAENYIKPKMSFKVSLPLVLSKLF